MFKEIKWKIKLYKYILEVSESQVNSYSDDIKKNIELINSDDEGISNKIIIDIRNRYLERVFRIVLEYISQERFEIYDEIKKIMEKPAICGYKDINFRAMKLLPRGGYFATASCSHFMPDELFVKMLRSAAKDAGVELRQIEARQQSPDHPILWNVPETDYLKFYIFQVI